MANRNNPNRDVTLMTLLAYDATADSRRLLKKYGQEDAKNHADLEYKLAKLYSAADNKIALEKEMAEIHPHKKWLMRTLKLEVVKPEPPKEEKTEAAAPFMAPTPSIINDLKSNADGTEPASTNQSHQQYLQILGVIGIVGVVLGLTVTALVVLKKK